MRLRRKPLERQLPVILREKKQLLARRIELVFCYPGEEAQVGGFLVHDPFGRGALLPGDARGLHGQNAFFAQMVGSLINVASALTLIPAILPPLKGDLGAF